MESQRQYEITKAGLAIAEAQRSKRLGRGHLGKRTKEKGKQEKESCEDMATSKYFMGPVFVWPESLIPVTPK